MPVGVRLRRIVAGERTSRILMIFFPNSFRFRGKEQVGTPHWDGRGGEPRSAFGVAD